MMVTKTSGNRKRGSVILDKPLEEILGDGQQAVSRIVKVRRLPDQRIQVPIIGISPLLMHAFPEKAQREMEQMQQRKREKRGRKAAPDAEAAPLRASPEEQFERAKHLLQDGRYGFPASAFKAAIVEAGGLIGLVMRDLQKLIFVVGEGADQLIPLDVDEPEMDARVGRASDMARTPIRTYRPRFDAWAATLTVEFPPNLIDAESIVNLVDIAGHRIGIGDWRPGAPRSRNGSHGRWEVRANA